MADELHGPPLDAIAGRTLGHYESRAEQFWEGTRAHDVSQNRAALLDALRGFGGDTGASASAKPAPEPGARPPRPLRILDFGCGPGRDLTAFRALGHAPVGLDGCAAFVEMARVHSSCEVWHQSFFDLNLGQGRFDGVFANASLFHVPRSVLPRVLGALFDVLVPGGVLFCSNPRSFDVDSEGWQGERYGCHLTVETWRSVIAAAGFVLEAEFLRPADQPPERQPWLAMVWRK